MKRAQNILFIYLFVGVLFTAIFFILFHTSVFAAQTVLFYRGVALLLITFFLTACSIYIFGTAWVVYYAESIVASLIIAIAIHLALFIVFPVTFERSVTMYLLAALQQNSSCTNKTNLTNSLVDQYVIKNDAVGKRINEQGIIGMVQNKNECVNLTSRGRQFLQFSEVVKKLYGVK